MRRSRPDDLRPGIRVYVLGIDIDDETAQISFMKLGTAEPETLSVKTGADDYSIPVLLAKCIGDEKWLYGREAEAAVREDPDSRKVKPADKLLSKAAAGGTRIIDGEEYDNVSLLALYLRRILSLLSMDLDLREVETVVFTLESYSREKDRAITDAMESITPDIEYVVCRSHEDSLYHYMLAQPPELMNRDVLAFHYNYGEITIYDMRTNHRTKPVVVTVSCGVEKNLMMPDRKLPQDEIKRKKRTEWLDEEFLRLCEKTCAGRLVSTVHLLGRAFEDGWMHKSLEFLCRTRRVFQGNNLFSKGACYTALAIMDDSREEGFILLDGDKLRANLGVEIIRRGEKSYQPLLDAGANWYDAGREIDLIHEYGDTIDIRILPLTGGNPGEISIELPELPERPARCTRLRLRADMADRDNVRVRITDLGFGEFFPGTGMFHEEIVRL